MGESKRERLDFLMDFQPGPLDTYRHQASFNWKEMAVAIESPVTLKFKNQVWSMLEKDPLFGRSQTEMSFEEYRDITMKRVLRILDYNLLPEEKMLENPSLSNALTIALQQYDGSVATKKGILTDFFTNAIRGLGTARHYETLEAASNGKIFGCVAITEVGHGSNARGLKTTATYHAPTQSFILTTPDFLAAKCWAGNLGKTATHACVTAKLYTTDKETDHPKCHGLASFVVPIRDPKTMLPFPGVIIADLGPKLGLNGLDNGLLIFENYSIPRESLLNKLGDVTPEGNFLFPKKFIDPSKTFSASLGNLSAARAGLIPMINQLMCDALTIAIRYSCVRRQFSGDQTGEEAVEECPIIEYQTHQYRLIPYLAAAYVMKYFGHSIFNDYVSFLFKSFAEPDNKTVKLMGTEIHILSSSAKPLASWLSRDAVQEARECCGGHGYLKLSGFGALRNDNDANLTHEGDNHVLIQQTSNFLLNLFSDKSNLENMSRRPTPLKTMTFLQEMEHVSSLQLNAKTTKELIDPTKILKMYKWLICRLLTSTHEKFNAVYNQSKDRFIAKNESQIYFAKNLSLSFIEHYALEHFWSKLLCDRKLSDDLHIVLTKIMCLYGLWSLEKYLPVFYQWGYMNGPKDADLLRESVLVLCKDLKKEAVALVDAIAPPDFVLNSVLGVSDGDVYKHLQNALFQNPGAFQRGKNWESISRRLTGVQSKL